MRNYKRPMYSKMHYEDMAESLRLQVSDKKTRDKIESFLIMVFKADNGKFDKIRFAKAVKREERQ